MFDLKASREIVHMGILRFLLHVLRTVITL